MSDRNVFGTDADKLIERITAAGHTLSRDAEGNLCEVDSLPPEDHHTMIYCERCAEFWCYWCRELVEKCPGEQS